LFFRSFITGYQGMLYMYSGDVQAATEALEASTRIGQAAGNITITVLGLCHLAELAMIEGQLHRAKVLYERALALGEDDQGRLQPIAGMAVMGLGKLDLVWHELDAAEQHLTEGIELTHRWGEVGTIGGYVGLARIKQARGDIDAARALIQEAQRLAENFDAMEADDVYVAVNRARLAISQGDFESALGWLRSRDLRDALDPAEFAGGPADTSVPYNRVSEYMLLAEIYGAQGQAGKALKILEPLLALSEAAGWTILVLRLLVLEVLAFDAQGDRERAVACLTRALVLGEPEEHMWAFLEGVQHEEVGALLRHVAEQGVSPGYVASILAKLGEEAPALASADTAQAEAQPPAPGSAPSSPPLVDPLTEREREVLQLLTSSLSSTEMAEQLFISVNTVRSHVRSIYGKLDVHSRYEAVDRAKALGLL